MTTRSARTFAVVALFVGLAGASFPALANAPSDYVEIVNRLAAHHRLYTPVPKPNFGGVQDARSGCCSHHGGVAGCDSATGHQACNDGSDSPTCGCE